MPAAEGVRGDGLRCLVIGGTRALGPAVVRRLCDRGWNVTVLHRGIHRAPLPEGVATIADEAAGIPVLSVPRAAIALSADVVLHLVAMGERDTRVATEVFAGRAGRLVVLSSGDVYRAYGRFIGSEPGPPDPVPLSEDAPLRERLYPYRATARCADELAYWYDKILVERMAQGRPDLPATVLRLPKLYGPGENEELSTVYGCRHRPGWRWTHGYLDNVAHGIALAVTDPRAAGAVYNLGEVSTPTMAERLAGLPERPPAEPLAIGSHFEQHMVLDTTKIRRDLGYAEPVDERLAMREWAARCWPACGAPQAT